MKYLITGASGFIGGALSAKLAADGHEVHGFVRDGDVPLGCGVIRGKLERYDDIRRAVHSVDPDVVFHLGAQALVGVGKSDPMTTLDSNIKGTYNLLEAVRSVRTTEPFKRIRVVVASSDKAYGALADGKAAYDEHDPLDGRGIYDCSKACTDILAQSYMRSYRMPIAIARLGNVYGPGDSDMSRIVPSVVRALVAAKPVEIMSDGSPVRDYLYIDDAVSAYEFLGKSLLVGAFNFSSETPLSVLELVDCARDVLLENFGLESHEPIVFGARNDEIQRQILDCSKVSKYKWSAKISLKEGLRRTFMAAGLDPVDELPF